MKRLKYLLILLLIVSYSCEDFLNVKPEGEVVNDELFKNEEGFEDAIYGVYSQLAGPSFYGKTMTYYLNDVLGQYFFHDYSGDITLKLSTFNYLDQDVRPVVDTVWSGMYKNISYVNNILVNLSLHPENSFRLYAVYKAECLALRAFMHFEVLRLYTENIVENPKARGIPYYEHYSYEVSPFLSAEDSYKKIIGDLTTAEALMLEHGEYFEEASDQSYEFLKDRQIHFNLYAIEALLARIYWTKGDLKLAEEYARKVLKSGFFELVDKSGIENLMNGVLSPKETIFGLYSSRLYTSVRADLYLTGNPNCLSLKSEHEAMYMKDKEGTDFRYEKWFKNVSDPGASGLRCVKILDTYVLGNLTRAEDRIKGINIIRLPELYYIIAEYYLSQGDQDNAVFYFDQVLKSRGLTPYAERQGATLTLEKINNERRKEYICEGQYFHVLKRYNMDVYEPKSGQTFKGSKEIYVFPLPANENDYRN